MWMTLFSSIWLPLALEECGVFLSIDYPFLATSPDGVIYLRNEEFGIMELINIVTAPLKWHIRIPHSVENNEMRLKRTHNYYFQVIGQLALTGAKFCDFMVWTKVDFHRARILPDDELRSEMKKNSHFYMTTLGVEILQRLYSM